MATTIDFSDLEEAFLWASGSYSHDTAAYISRSTGQCYYCGDESPDEIPDDIEDDSQYACVPSQHDLDLGQRLIHRFIGEQAPHLEQDVYDIFRHKGAYSRFKNLLAAKGLLDRWHQYENQATREALTEWAEENGFKVQ
ncbi:UPF0158 family protein [Pseudomonas sp. SH1-B]